MKKDKRVLAIICAKLNYKKMLVALAATLCTIDWRSALLGMLIFRVAESEIVKNKETYPVQKRLARGLAAY